MWLDDLLCGRFALQILLFDLGVVLQSKMNSESSLAFEGFVAEFTLKGAKSDLVLPVHGVAE